MKKFISCDWGTSSLRLRIVDPISTSVLGEIISDQGIFKTFELWKGSARDQHERLTFYQSILAEQIALLENQWNVSVQDHPIVISGMASSIIGMMELPYKQMPFAIDGNDLEIRHIDQNGNFKHEIILISGAASSKDIMRGEETQLISCMQGGEKGERLF